MNTHKYLIFCLLCIIGCTNKKVLLNNLSLVNNKYCSLGKGSPFTGEAISKFKNGQISNDFIFNNGIPIGKWVSYGYAGEVVQSGTYRPLLMKNNFIPRIPEIVRINLCFTNEGNEHFWDLLIITNKNKLEINKVNAPSTYKALIDILKSNKIKIDTSLINSIRCTKGELEQ